MSSVDLIVDMRIFGDLSLQRHKAIAQWAAYADFPTITAIALPFEGLYRQTAGSSPMGGQSRIHAIWHVCRAI